MTPKLKNWMDLPPISKIEWDRKCIGQARKEGIIILLRTIAVIGPIVVIGNSNEESIVVQIGGIILFLATLIVQLENSMDSVPKRECYAEYVEQYYASVVDRRGKPIQNEDEREDEYGNGNQNWYQRCGFYEDEDEDEDRD